MPGIRLIPFILSLCTWLYQVLEVYRCLHGFHTPPRLLVFISLCKLLPWVWVGDGTCFHPVEYTKGNEMFVITHTLLHKTITPLLPESLSSPLSPFLALKKPYILQPQEINSANNLTEMEADPAPGKLWWEPSPGW